MWIDSHAHLDDRRLLPQLDALLARCRAADVGGVLALATDRESCDSTLALLAGRDMVRAAVGIHPNSAGAAEPADWDEIVGLAERPGVVALGETGLDRYRDSSPFAAQQDYFQRHLDLSRTTGLPVCIHCREAAPDVLAMLRNDFEKHGPVRGVIHSFSEDVPFMEAVTAMGLYVSFSGVLTFKNAGVLRDVAKLAPTDRVLVETDAPYLAPMPHRGKTNEPAYVAHTGVTLAELRGVSVGEMARVTTENARRLFERWGD